MPDDEVPESYARVGELQEELGRAKQAGDVDGELGALLGIAKCCLDDDDLGGAHMHFKLAERVARSADRTTELSDALGGQGRVRRRRRDPAGAIECFLAAEEAARTGEDVLREAEWALARGAALRETGDRRASGEAVRAAEQLIRPHRTDGGIFVMLGSVNTFDPRAMAVVAELEGQLGLTALADGDEEAAEDHYETAVLATRSAGDDEALAVWSTNLGNARTRVRRYTDAVAAYTEAHDAATRARSARLIRRAALQLADCFERAYRFQEAGERLLEIAESLDGDEQVIVRDRAHGLLERVRVPSGGGEPPPDVRGPTAVDLHLAGAMRAATEDDNLGAALEAAEVVCDLKAAVTVAGGRHWKRMMGGDLLSETGLDMRALTDALRLLLARDRGAEAFEILQRYKGPGACASVVRRYAETGAPCPEGDRYVAALRDLRDSVEPLAGPVTPASAVAVAALRAAGERLRETGEELRERDPFLHARMGGVVRPDELIDALPVADPVAIVDFVVGAEATVGVVVMRAGTEVRVIPLIAERFTAEDALELLQVYADAGLAKAFGPRQAQAITRIGKVLHDRMFCSLAQALSGMGVTQLILVPDAVTRFLPLHLAQVCGAEVHVPVEAEGAEYLCEVMPVELAPSVQSVAASALYRRPRHIRRIVGFGDPLGDLPAARATLEGFRERLADPDGCDLHVGKAATTAALEDALEHADMLLFGTHGELSLDAPEQSRLVLADGQWTLRDVVDAPDLGHKPLLVLAACEIGAPSVGPDDREAYGISGALLAAGASAVLANMWPVEDLSAGYLVERFLHYLGHPGYRPSAALFRAVRDMRRLGRNEAIDLCRRHLALLKAAGAGPREIIAAENMLELIEDGHAEHPFAEPLLWGASVIVGSGWALPAGATVSNDPLTGPMQFLEQQRADWLVRDGEYGEALALARTLAAQSDGVPRARMLVTQALTILRSAELTTLDRAKRRARGLLASAERIAHAEDDANLLERVAYVRWEMGDGDVVTAQQ